MRFIAFLDQHKPDWARCDMCFIAMERCAGGSLVDWLARMKASGRRTSVAEAGVIGAQLVSALSYCHAQQIGHFDLKPGNVFIMADCIEVSHFLLKKILKLLFQIKLGDFGSALTIASALESTRTGA